MIHQIIPLLSCLIFFCDNAGATSNTINPPPMLPPWELNISSICTDDETTCCPYDLCNDEAMYADPTPCISAASEFCVFDVKADGVQWLINSKYETEFGCLDFDSSTIYASLPANVFDSMEVWDQMTIDIFPLNMNNSKHCFNIEWRLEMISWPPDACTSILNSPDLSSSIYQTPRVLDPSPAYGILKDFPLNVSAETHEHTAYLLQFDLSEFLGNRSFTEQAGVRMQPLYPGDCNLTWLWSYRGGTPYDDDRLTGWAQWPIQARYRASGRVHGQLKGGPQPPADLTVPTFFRFRRPPKDTKISVYEAAV